MRNIATISAGQGAPQGDSNYCEDGTPFVKAGNLAELLNGKPINTIQKVSESVAKQHRLKLFPKGTVLFAKSGMSCLKGYVYVLPVDAYVVNHLACVTTNIEMSSYLRYFFNYHKPNKLVKDEAYPSISLEDIGDMTIDVKTDKEREYIVSVLDHVVQLIKLRQQQLLALDTLIKARFLELYNSSALSEEMSIEAIVKRVKVGFVGTCEKHYTDKPGIPMLRTGNITDNGIDLSDLKYVTSEFHEKNLKSQIRAGDILIARHGSNGQANVYYGPVAQCLNAVIIVPNPEIASSVFLANLINSPMVRSQIDRTLVGSTQHVVNTKSIATIIVRIPNLAIQRKFEIFVSQVDKSKSVVQAALEKAQLLFDSLMQQYFG